MSYAEMNVRGQWMWLGRTFSLGLIVALALVLCASTALAAVGILPWLEISASLNGEAVPYAGMGLQIGATILVVGLCFFLPSDRRMMALENTHRDFQISMDDVERAYQSAHASDRQGAFRLSSEFDAVRERIVFLRDHPDLRSLEPDVLELAAQMSEKSRELAGTYSTERIERARVFLRQRQEEIADFDQKIAMVHETLAELKRWSEQLNVEDALRDKQIDQLETELFALLPDLGFEVGLEKIDPEIVEEEIATRKPNVITLSHKFGGQATP